MSIEPTPSFPSLRSLLERLPADGDPYTNGALFDQGYADADVDVTVIDRPTPTPMVLSAPPPAPRRPWGLWVAPLAFVLGIGATLAVDRGLAEEPARVAPSAAGHVLDAAASLRLVTEVEIVATSAEAPEVRPSRGPATARQVAAATPIEPAAAEDLETTRAALRAALVGDGAARSTAFDREAARLAVNSTASAAKGCADGSVTGEATVTVTFAHSGHATSALVSGTLAGTAVGSCIANVMRGARVPAYEGDLVSVRRVVRIR